MTQNDNTVYVISVAYEGIHSIHRTANDAWAVFARWHIGSDAIVNAYNLDTHDTTEVAMPQHIADAVAAYDAQAKAWHDEWVAQRETLPCNDCGNLRRDCICYATVVCGDNGGVTKAGRPCLNVTDEWDNAAMRIRSAGRCHLHR